MSLSDKIQTLRPLLSSDATIITLEEAGYDIKTARWNDWKAPQSGAVVSIASEADVEATVKWAVENGVKFLAQGGAHGYTSTWTLDREGIIINLRALRSMEIDAAAGTAVVGAGILVGEATDEAFKAGMHMSLGTCDTVGVAGACLGGGFGRLQAVYGYGVDNMLSARIVTAEGKAITVSATENPDLWWSIRGAGHNFGIMTSFTARAYPQINSGMHWTSFLSFTPDKVEEVTKLVNDLDMRENMSIHILCMCFPPTFQPAFAVSAWYGGAEEPAKKSFASLLSAGAVFEQSGMTPYNKLNAGADPLTVKGGRKPSPSLSVERLDPAGVREIWNMWIEALAKYPKELAESGVMFECYSDRGKDVPVDEMAFCQRHTRFSGLALLKYSDPALDDEMKVFSDKFRAILKKGSALDKSHVYVNFAIGDETVEEIYGYDGQVPKLRELKKKWDPSNQFSQYNPFV